MLTISYLLHSTWSKISLRDQHIFQQVHMRDETIISLTAADPTWTIRHCGFAGEVDHWTQSWEIYVMKSVTPHISMNCYENKILSTLEQDLSDNEPEHKCSVTQNKSQFGTPIILHLTLDWQGQNTLSLKREASN